MLNYNIKHIFNFIYISFWIIYYLFQYYFTNLTYYSYFYKSIYTRLDLIKNITYKIESINIVYVKIFQSICVSNKILSDEENNYLIKYSDNVPFNIDEVDYDLLNQIQKEFEIDIYYNTPVNSGIIAIVFYGFYKKNNKNIVIKVLKKNIEKKLNSFIKELEFIGFICNYIPYINKLNLNSIIKDNKLLILNQINFDNELNNIQTFKIKNQNFNFLTIPNAYPEFTNKYKNIIVMDNIKGLTINDIKLLSNEIKEQFGEILIKIGYNNILFTGTLHSDLHSGNIFFYIANDNDLKLGLPKYRIGFIDFGLCIYLNNNEKSSLYHLFFNIAVNNITNNHDENMKLIDMIFKNDSNYQKLNIGNKKKLEETFINTIIQYANNNNNNKSNLDFVYPLQKIAADMNIQTGSVINKILLSIQSSNLLCNELVNDTYNTQIKVVKEVVNSYNNLKNLIEI